MQKILSLIDRLLHFLLITTVLLLIIPVSLQIFSRFTALIPSYIWTEEMARFLFIWMIMIGAMIGTVATIIDSVSMNMPTKSTAFRRLRAAGSMPSVRVCFMGFRNSWRVGHFTAVQA